MKSHLSIRERKSKAYKECEIVCDSSQVGCECDKWNQLCELSMQ